MRNGDESWKRIFSGAFWKRCEGVIKRNGVELNEDMASPRF
jgi:hypothetical protein